ncbi:MAG: cupin domain-containing protein, partial [Trebonia sp.]
MSTKTTTKVAHYYVQKQRRAEFIEEWRANQRTVVALEDVEMHETSRRMRRGVYVGADGGRPTRSMDATAHEIDPGAVSTVHRHSWDAMMFCVAGEAWTEIDGERIEWGPGDSLHLPAWSWHRHGNNGSTTARYLTFSSEPMLETMGMAMIEDGGDADVATLAPRPPFSPAIDGSDPYAERLRRLAADQEARRGGRLHTSWDSLEILPKPRGTPTSLHLDRAIGYQASGIT